jgi:hypothetical protein
MNDDKPIKACVCGETSFAQLKAMGVRSLEDAQRLGCGVKCGLCISYIQQMIDNGETEFPVPTVEA